jgi:class 3 adenylate cyclase
MAAKKSAGKVKSAVSGKFVSKAEAAKNPRETYVGTTNPKHVVLRLADLVNLRALAEAQLDFVNEATYQRIHDELVRAIGAHRKAAK